MFTKQPSITLEDPRRKYLNIPRFRENLEYICKNHPEAVTTLNTMHGFPTETEEEALTTLDFIFSMTMGFL